METWTIYGIGGYCVNCDETHDHPLHNIIEEREIITDEPVIDPIVEEPII